jgi:hypothetical protein
MFYTITKRIAQSAMAFLIMLIAFSFAFFIINSGTDSDKFENPGRKKNLKCAKNKQVINYKYVDKKGRDLSVFLLITKIHKFLLQVKLC